MESRNPVRFPEVGNRLRIPAARKAIHRVALLIGAKPLVRGLFGLARSRGGRHCCLLLTRVSDPGWNHDQSPWEVARSQMWLQSPPDVARLAIRSGAASLRLQSQRPLESFVIVEWPDVAARRPNEKV